MNGITADEMRERSEAGQRAAELKQLLDGVLLECVDAAQFGLCSATARLSDNDLPFRDDLISILRSRNYMVTTGSNEKLLYLSWEKPEQ